MATVLYIQNILYLLLGVVAFGVELWAAVDCLRRRSGDFERSMKRTKGFWTALTVGGAVIGGLSVSAGGSLFILELAGVVAAGVYLADVRPAIRNSKGGYW